MTELKLLDSKTYLDCVKELLGLSKASLMDMVNELSQNVPAPYVITAKGKEVPDPGLYIPPKKTYAYKASDAAAFVAVFFHNPENLRLYWNRVDEKTKTLVALLMQEGFVSAPMLQTLGFGNMFVLRKDRYYYETHCEVTSHKAWFKVVTCRCAGDSWWEMENYLHLNPAWSIPAVLSLGLLRDVWVQTLPSGLQVRSAESEAIASVPLIRAVLKQGTLKFSTAKVTAASSLKFMKTLPIPELMPDFSEYGDKFNSGQLFLPLFNILTAAKRSKQEPEVIRSAVETLFGLASEYAMPMLMPHVKGFRTSATRYALIYCREALRQYLKSGHEGYLDLKNLCIWSALSSQLTLNPNNVDEMRLEDSVSGESVTLDKVLYFENQLAASLCMCLYDLGAVEVAVEEKDSYGDPFTHIKAVRLTALGRYAFGLDSSYKAPVVSKEPLFELDGNRLVIRSLKPGNPYEGLLNDTSVPVGNNRFQMSPESFLKNCKTSKDVKEKIAFFKEYVCAEPPAVWREFFKTIERRCNPLKEDMTEYYVYQVDPSDTGLVDIITTDMLLKDIVIRAEGFRILVPYAKRTSFVNRLKTYGYLL